MWGKYSLVHGVQAHNASKRASHLTSQNSEGGPTFGTLCAQVSIFHICASQDHFTVPVLGELGVTQRWGNSKHPIGKIKNFQEKHDGKT